MEENEVLVLILPAQGTQTIGRPTTSEDILARGKTLPNKLLKEHPHPKGNGDLPYVVEVIHLPNFAIEGSNREHTRCLQRP
jgi:hypothetical protein